METLDGRPMHICEVTVEGYQAICIDEKTTSTAIATRTTASALLSTTPPTTQKTTSAVAITTQTKTTTTETEARPQTTSTIPTTSSETKTDATIWNRTTTLWKNISLMPRPATSKTEEITSAVSATLTALSLLGSNTTTATNTCPCYCGVSPNTTNLTHEALEELIKGLTKELTVNKKETSISKRKLISAGDDRESAATIGCIGVLALCVPVLVIVSSDLINLWSAKQKQKRVKK
ncbi:integumentary mucin C.1-like [Mizuhopecten yessoensis]|uniref:integumentary mucin C.1-like n=1 Tax=Mizuhopecten yessoensis TaxID=6573 RepID=UPI000B45E034|nr:integumentary mucin C.1-like [Mizuhopecten yessoensis]